MRRGSRVKVELSLTNDEPLIHMRRKASAADLALVRQWLVATHRRRRELGEALNGPPPSPPNHPDEVQRGAPAPRSRPDASNPN